MTKEYQELYNVTEGFKQSKLFHKITFTPELATDLLSHNTRNRRLSLSRVQKYASEIKEGKWKHNGLTVTISNTGVLLDGQSRLNAIRIAGIPVEMNFETGLPDEVSCTIDQGKIRTTADILTMDGLKNTSSLGSALKFIFANRIGKAGAYSASQFRITNSDLQELITELGPLEMQKIENSIGWAKTLYSRNPLFNPSYVGALAYLFGKTVPQAQVEEFFELAISGNGVSETVNSSIYILRNRFIKSLSKTHKMDVREKVAIMIKAFYAFIENKQVKTLRYNIEETFPVIKGTEIVLQEVE